jgi:hypothetical protein
VTPPLCPVVANPSFYRTFGSAASATVGNDLFKIDGGRWDQPRLRALLKDVIPEDRSFKDVRHPRDMPKWPDIRIFDQDGAASTTTCRAKPLC